MAPLVKKALDMRQQLVGIDEEVRLMVAEIESIKAKATGTHQPA
jgi:hypothetical protein